MKQITQRELIKLIKEKQAIATCMEERLRIQAISKDDLDTAKKCFGEARAYQDLICYLESVEIVTEEQIVSTIPKAKQEELGITQEDLKKFIPNKKDKIKEFEEKVIMKPFIDELKKIDLNKIPIMNEYINIRITPYALPYFLYACKCSKMYEITMTAEDNNLVARISSKQINDIIYPKEYKAQVGENDGNIDK